uniref:Nucleotide-Sugar Epimerase n=1 Tax=Florenciella sp. virus SA2 TaxID=3240092 RepID=A0AB39JEK4_9VIRU
MSYKIINNCRVCNSSVIELLDLNDQPLANSFQKDPFDYNKYPLKLMLCQNCWHTQLSVVVDPNILFKHYLWVSGTSNTMLNYWKWFVEEFVQKKYLKCGTVLDIACNDSTLLDSFNTNGWKTYGVDPAENLIKESSHKPHHLFCNFWNYDTSNIIKQKCNTFDIITAQNVFAHLDDIHDFLKASKNVMNETSTLFIQTSQKNQIYGNEFDTIYHEHVSFYSISSMIKVAELNNLYVNNVFYPDIHGTSYLFELSKVRKKGNILEEYKKEKISGKYDFTLYEIYKNNCILTKKIVNEKIAKFKKRNQKIIGFGAAAKATVFINFCDIDLNYIVDENPKKQNLFIPGTNIIVKDLQHFSNEPQDMVCIIFAWNYSKEITNKIKSNRPNNKDLIISFYPEYKEH